MVIVTDIPYRDDKLQYLMHEIQSMGNGIFDCFTFSLFTW